MDAQRLQAYRIERLEALVQKEGGKAALGRKLGYRDGAFIGQMLRGERPVSEKTVQTVNALPEYKGWFSIENQNIVIKNDNSKLPEALAVVAAALCRADDLTIDQVRPLLARLVDSPERAPEIVPRLSMLLE